jgi:glycosyltransferase involved in cell wall biosynthesis
VVNEPVRRNRITGTDLLPLFARSAPLDVFGMGTDDLAARLGLDPSTPIRSLGDLPQHRMHAEMARRRVYLHPLRWTSLGLALIEAMHLGMPVVALAATEAPEAVPPGTGYCSTDTDRLARGLRELVAEPELAARMGSAARRHALDRYGLDRFLASWEDVLLSATERRRPAGRRMATAATTATTATTGRS